FALVNTSADECDYRSREGGPAPTLIVTVARAAPTVTIAAPAAGSIFFQRDAITFAAQARDAEDGELSSRIEWTSSRDGSLGTWVRHRSPDGHTDAARGDDGGARRRHDGLRRHEPRLQRHGDGRDRRRSLRRAPLALRPRRSDRQRSLLHEHAPQHGDPQHHG